MAAEAETPDVQPGMNIVDLWRVRDYRIARRVRYTTSGGAQPHPYSEREALLVYQGRVEELNAIPLDDRPKNAYPELDDFRARHGLDADRRPRVS